MCKDKENFPLKQFDPEYLVTLDEIYHSHWAARKSRRIHFLKEAVKHFWPNGHPTRLIHVTGTNGKGSVISYLEQGFPEPSGSWTGPHVFDYAERFHIQGKVARHDEMTAIYHNTLLPYQHAFAKTYPGESLSFAELGILLALHLFERHGIRWGMMEVGAGGRYTPLMALTVDACVLTNIGEDHPKTLGTEIWQRALEKAGIARKGIPFFTSATEPGLKYVKKTAMAAGAKIQVVDGDGGKLQFQTLNKKLARRVIQYFFPQSQPQPDLWQVNLPARFRHITTNIIADIAHNTNKIAMLAETLKSTYPGKTFRFLLGLTRSRDAVEVFSPLLDIAQHIVFTGASYAGQDPHDLAEKLKRKFPRIEVVEDPREAYQREVARLKKDDLLVLTGSAYMIDQALNPNPFIRHLNATFGRRKNE